MSIKIHPHPELLETYFLDEARTTPTACWTGASSGVGFLGPGIRRMTGHGIMAGWALTVSVPPGDNLATYVALQYMLDHATAGRWVMVVAPWDEDSGNTSLWSYMQCAMGWEVGFVGAVVAGYVRDIDEVKEKLEKEFSVFAYGGSPLKASLSPEGEIGSPVKINGVNIRTGDLIVGDSDGVICVPKDQIVDTAEKCRMAIVEEVNLLQHVREGMGAVDVMRYRELLTGKVDLEAE
jgi:4-hydroxy-4-methyl-2-oxoglutarate aldolase